MIHNSRIWKVQQLDSFVDVAQAVQQPQPLTAGFAVGNTLILNDSAPDLRPEYAVLRVEDGVRTGNIDAIQTHTLVAKPEQDVYFLATYIDWLGHLQTGCWQATVNIVLDE